MATSIVRDTYDKNAATEDWRTGVVELPPDHVYGATALTQQEWRKLAHRRSGPFVLVDSGGTREFISPLRGFADAMCDFRHSIDRTDLDYRPDTGRRLVVKGAER